MKVVSPPLRLTNADQSAYVQDIVFTKEFYHPHCSLSLRPFYILIDLPDIYNRVTEPDSISELIAAGYLNTRRPGFASSYMVLLDHHLPLCEVDISPALQDELCDYFKAEPGDYIVRFLPASPGRIRRRLFSGLVATCLEYFLEFSEVKKIFIESETDNSWQHDLLLKNGFRFREVICHEYKDTHLYQYTPSLRKRSR